MRIERIGRRTWFLGVVAAWALMVWWLALAGMGGRLSAPAGDSALAPALPALMVPVDEAFAAGSALRADIAARPLFSEDRRPRPFVLAGEEQPAGAFDYVLTSVLIVPPLEMAILQSVQGDRTIRLKTGQSPPSSPEWRLVLVAPRSVVFEGPEGERTLPLRSYGGATGGVELAVDASPMMVDPSPAPIASTNSGGRQIGASQLADDATLAAAAAVTPESRAAEREALRQRIEARRARLNRGPNPDSPTPP